MFFSSSEWKCSDSPIVVLSSCAQHTRRSLLYAQDPDKQRTYTRTSARAHAHTRARMRARGISKYNSRAICLLLLKGTKKRAAVKHSFFLNFSSRFAKNRCVFTLFHQTQCRAPLVIVPCHTSPSSGSQTGIISTTSSSSA